MYSAIEFTVKEISNGFLVEFQSHGKVLLKEPYVKGIYYYASLEDLFEYCKEIVMSRDLT